MRNFLYKHRLWPPKPSELADGDKVRANRSLRTKGLTPVHLPKNKEPTAHEIVRQEQAGTKQVGATVTHRTPDLQLTRPARWTPNTGEGERHGPTADRERLFGQTSSQSVTFLFFRDVALSAENSRRTELKGYKGGGIVYLKKSAPDNRSTACSFEIRRYLSNAEMLLWPDANIQSRTGTPER